MSILKKRSKSILISATKISHFHLDGSLISEPNLDNQPNTYDYNFIKLLKEISNMKYSGVLGFWGFGVVAVGGSGGPEG